MKCDDQIKEWARMCDNADRKWLTENQDVGEQTKNRDKDDILRHRNMNRSQQRAYYAIMSRAKSEGEWAQEVINFFLTRLELATLDTSTMPVFYYFQDELRDPHLQKVVAPIRMYLEED